MVQCKVIRAILAFTFGHQAIYSQTVARQFPYVRRSYDTSRGVRTTDVSEWPPRNIGTESKLKLSARATAMF